MHSAVPADDAWRDRVHQKFLAGKNTYDPDSNAFGIDADYPVLDLMKWPHIHGTPVSARTFRPGFSNPGFPDCYFSQNRGILRAYDPFTMQLVWSNKEDKYWFAKFVSPTVAAGNIFIATASGKVLVYGP